MVQNILDTHSGIYGGPEFDRISNIIDLRRKLITSVSTGRINIYTNKTEIDQYIRTLISSLLGNVKTDKQLKYVSEKTPWNILVFEDLMELFPDAKFIHVLRNPMDVFSSMKQVAARAEEKKIPAPDFTRNVNVALGYMLSVYMLMNKIASEKRKNVMTVRYEDLIRDLEGQSKQICDFVELPWEKALLDFNKIDHPGEKNMVGNEIWYTAEMFRQDPDKKRNLKKKYLLTSSERMLLETVLGKDDYLLNNGYKIVPPGSIYEKLIGKYLAKNFYEKYNFKHIPIRVLG